MELEVGMLVRTKWGCICEIININDFREPSMKYGVEASYLKDVMFIGDEDISKASHSLLGNEEEPCLIEVGDYVNGLPVRFVEKDRVDIGQCENYWWIKNDSVKSIVTSEQFSQMEYRVGE